MDVNGLYELTMTKTGEKDGGALIHGQLVGMSVVMSVVDSTAWSWVWSRQCWDNRDRTARSCKNSCGYCSRMDL